MNILLVLIPVTLLVIVIAVALFFWAVNHHQFDDLESPAELPLMEDPPPDPAQSSQPDDDNAPPAHAAQHIHNPRDPDQS